MSKVDEILSRLYRKGLRGDWNTEEAQVNKAKQALISHFLSLAPKEKEDYRLTKMNKIYEDGYNQAIQAYKENIRKG